MSEQTLTGLASWWLMKASDQGTRPKRLQAAVYRECAEALLAALREADRPAQSLQSQPTPEGREERS